MSKHQLYCHHDNRHRYPWIFFLTDEEGCPIKDEAGKFIVKSQGPYKAKTWRFGEVRERFPPLNEMIHGALYEIHFRNYWDASVSQLTAAPPKGDKNAIDHSKNCQKIEENGLGLFIGEKNQDTYMVWCLYSKNFSGIVPDHAIPNDMDPNTSMYDVCKLKKEDKPKK